MLMRAAVISVLLHLMILLSMIHLEMVNRPAISWHEMSALNVALGQFGQADAHSANIRKSELVGTKSEKVVRKSGVHPEPKVGDLNFGKFFRSTVELTRSGKAEPKVAIEQKAAESQPLSAEEIGRYRLNVARSARQFKAYPLVARENRWQGVVHVSVAMPIGPGAPIVLLEHSSGYDVLDRQALEMIERAVSLAVLPDGMRSRNLRISLPVEYLLAD